VRISRALLERALPEATIGADVPDDLGVVQTDSRALEGGQLFVAIAGERFDAHAFVEQALDKGASAALVSRVPDGVDATRCVVVEDSLRGMQDLAREVIRAAGVKRVALTGSNGKTTTKELIAAALSACAVGPVHKTRGNLNNHVGVPLTAFDLEETDAIAVFEMGMNHLGEIARLCEIVEPEVGLVTNIGTAHAGNVGGVEGVQRAKGELFFGLAPGGVAVVNLDDARAVSAANAAGGPRVTFGRGEAADVRIVAASPGVDVGLELSLAHQGREVSVSVPLDGAHNASNAAGAVAVAVACGFDFESAARGLRKVENIGGRLTRKRGARGTLILDDTYNANPDSVRAGLEALASLAGGRRKVAALGEMKEVDDEVAAHRATGRAAVEAGVTCLFACGDMGRELLAGAVAAGLDEGATRWAEDSKALAGLVAAELGEGDAVLVKGSRAAAMERVVERLMNDNQEGR
jgi:UDP-N-acetylmuramoyl-tripeptide--D-alanyl-D-alanine ligase